MVYQSNQSGSIDILDTSEVAHMYVCVCVYIYVCVRARACALQTTITIMKEKLMMEKNIEKVQNTNNNNTNDIITILDSPTSKCKRHPRNRYKSLLKNYIKKGAK